jgi:hypothetical protein
VILYTYDDRFDGERIQLDGRRRFSRILLVIIRLPTFFRSHLEGRHGLERNLMEEKAFVRAARAQRLIGVILASDWLRETATKMN